MKIRKTCILVLMPNFCLTNAGMASETFNYSYDALGRLVGSGITGGPNDGTMTSIQLDAANNRTNYSVSKPSGGTCTLTASADQEASEYALYPSLVRSGSCSSLIYVSYNIQKLSGQPSYYDQWWLTSAAFDPADSSSSGVARYVQVMTGPIPPNDPVVLKITWNLGSGNAAFARNYTILTFYSDGCWC